MPKGEMYNPFVPIHRRKSRKELSVVKLKHDHADNDAQIIPAGSIGTIVHIWTAGMYSVEFIKPFHSVVNLHEKDIEDG